MEKETFDYSMVPNNFSLCIEQDCPNADTCLRRIAYDHVPASITFLSILNPKANKEATRKNVNITVQTKKYVMLKDLYALRES